MTTFQQASNGTSLPGFRDFPRTRRKKQWQQGRRWQSSSPQGLLLNSQQVTWRISAGCALQSRDSVLVHKGKNVFLVFRLSLRKSPCSRLGSIRHGGCDCKAGMLNGSLIPRNATPQSPFPSPLLPVSPSAPHSWQLPR
jgi:hypothetical protein